MTSSLQTILTCNSRVLSAKALAQVVQFVYTGDVDTALCAAQGTRTSSLLINVKWHCVSPLHCCISSSLLDTFLSHEDIKQAAEYLAIPDLYRYVEKLERVADEAIRRTLRRENDEVLLLALRTIKIGDDSVNATLHRVSLLTNQCTRASGLE